MLSGGELRLLANRLAAPPRRVEAATALAEALGAKALLVLVRDHELGVLRPAPGFQQHTLPGGATWRNVLRRCTPGADISGTISFPDANTHTAFRAVVGESGDVLILFGGTPAILPEQLDPLGFPLLCALLRSETVAETCSGVAAEARAASARAAALAEALDAARREMAEQAIALRQTLAEAERLNHALRDLNATLEHRVAERTEQLTLEMNERRKAEAALAQAQKMEAIGHLTGGVAHDFNNLLTVIIGSLELVTRAAPPDNARILRAAGNAAKAAQSAATLTSRLLAFSRRQPLNPKPTDINALIRDMSGLLHRTLGEPVELETVLGARLWPAEIDANQMESAILNLAVNARDAMPNGGSLTIETRNTYLDEDYARQFPEVRVGQYVDVSISDTGCGISPELLERVFEPFFTTKETGKGTGLGLSQVYGFLKQSGGHVRVYSEVGRGTTVRLYLPRYYGSDMHSETEQTSTGTLRACGETVLLVEDEPMVRAHSSELLRDFGYKVLEAGNADEALQVLHRARKVDMLFTDVVLPGQRTGRDLAEEVLRIKPNIKVLYTTGYARNAIVHHGRLDPGVNLITKPFSSEQLAAKLRAVLDQPG